MRTFLIAFALAFFAGIVLTWAVRNLAVRWGMYDAPEGGRKIHQRPIPRLGGVAVAISFFLPIIGLALWSNDISTALFREDGLLISLLGGGSHHLCQLLSLSSKLGVDASIATRRSTSRTLVRY